MIAPPLESDTDESETNNPPLSRPIKAKLPNTGSPSPYGESQRSPSSCAIAMTQTLSLRSRILGSLYGLPVGDALGAPYEFRVRGRYTVTSEMEESRIFKYQGRPLPPGTWTDDTSMALCLGKSLAEKGRLDWHDVANKWVRWYKNGYMSAIGYCFDIGLWSPFLPLNTL